MSEKKSVSYTLPFTVEDCTEELDTLLNTKIDNSVEHSTGPDGGPYIKHSLHYDPADREGARRVHHHVSQHVEDGNMLATDIDGIGELMLALGMDPDAVKAEVDREKAQIAASA